ncbi:MAG TPA: VOC family protein [Candidatus Acidoferrales bacterium]|nr:VOC family protein [Candidatus Acidoferrales bacterium]
MITHTSIRSSNLERSINFYRSIGFRVLGRVENKKNNADIILMQNAQGKGAVLEIIHYRGEINGWRNR